MTRDMTAGLDLGTPSTLELSLDADADLLPLGSAGAAILRNAALMVREARELGATYADSQQRRAGLLRALRACVWACVWAADDDQDGGLVETCSLAELASRIASIEGTVVFELGWWRP